MLLFHNDESKNIEHLDHHKMNIELLVHDERPNLRSKFFEFPTDLLHSLLRLQHY